jgi:hypothetical protein
MAGLVIGIWTRVRRHYSTINVQLVVVADPISTMSTVENMQIAPADRGVRLPFRSGIA